MKNEIWKDVVGYEGLYQVSNLGRVKSLDRVIIRKDGRKDRIKGRMLKFYNNKGYLYVDICKNGACKKCKVHRLVLQSFSSNPNNLPFVNHKDENKLNNRLCNLEWCDAKYNVNYGTCTERIRNSHISKIGRSIDMFDIDGNFIARYFCTKDVERHGFDRRAVDRCCKGLSHTHKGYKFSYSII
jgi:hypothetical protein